MNRLRRILLVMMTCLILSSAASIPAEAASSNPLTTQQEIQAKAILLKSMPSATDAELTQLVRDPNFVKSAAAITSVSVVPIASGTTVQAYGYTTLATTYCKWVWTRVRARGLFGTLFSYKIQLNWCYNGSRVSSPSYRITPDVTTYGSTFGWSYKGEWQPRNVHYYTYNGHRYGGYIAEAFGEFVRCLGGNVGCIDQRFADVAVRGHYDGTYTTRHVLN